MTRSLAMCAVLGLLPSVSAAEVFAAAPAVKISDTIEREASRLARSDDASQTSQDRSWARVTSMKSGSDVLLTTRRDGPQRRLFLNADASTLSVLDLSALSLRTEEFNALRGMAVTRPRYLIAGKAGHTIIYGSIEIRTGSVFYQSRRIASIDDLVSVIPRKDVKLIEIKDAPHLSAGKATLIGAIAGGVVGALVFAPRSAFAADNYTAFGVIVFAPNRRRRGPACGPCSRVERPRGSPDLRGAIADNRV